MRILHLISGLGAGGAEHMLSRLVAASPQIEHYIFSVSGPGILSEDLSTGGARLLNRPKGTSLVERTGDFARVLATNTPDVIQGWMYHGSLAALVAGARYPKARMYWNIRQSLAQPQFTRRSTRLAISGLAKASRIPKAIIYNAEAAAEDHERIGFSAKRRVTIPNGFDTSVFRPDPIARQAIRDELGISPDHLVFGLIARLDQWKNHSGFFQAASAVLQRHPEVTFVLAGTGLEKSNPEVSRLLGPNLADPRFKLLGDRRDVHRIQASLDFACNVSHGEGFPNAVGEAMSAGVPCLVTDVGASRFLIGDTGIPIRSTSAEAIAEAMYAAIGLSERQRTELGEAARLRIIDHFSIDRVVQQYLTLYRANKGPAA